MTRWVSRLPGILLGASLSFVVGCTDSTPRLHEEHAGEEHAKVCGFKEGHGVFVGDETRAAIALATMDVAIKPFAAKDPSVAVPESSLLSTVMGDFVFTANGSYFQRTAVKLAGRTDGWIAVADGLLEGDLVVTNGVRELWRIELQATKGGAACAH